MNRSLLLLVASIVCFVVLFLLAVDVVSNGNPNAWLASGLALFAASFLP